MIVTQEDLCNFLPFCEKVLKVVSFDTLRTIAVVGSCCLDKKQPD